MKGTLRWLAAILVLAGSLLLWGSTFVHNTVHNQLVAQQIYFPPAAFAPRPDRDHPRDDPSVSQYAGQHCSPASRPCC